MVSQNQQAEQQAAQLATNFGPNYGPQAPGLAEPGNIAPANTSMTSPTALDKTNQTFTQGPLSPAPGIKGTTQTPAPQTQTPQTQPQTQTPQTQTPSPSPATQSPSPGVPNPASPAATQAVISATQAAQANPDLASSVAATAPGLVAATAEAFRVPIPTAAMMVLQGMQSQEQRRIEETAGSSATSVGFSDLGGGKGSGGGNPSSPLNVDAMVSNVMSSPTAGLGAAPQDQSAFGGGGFKHGGLVQGLAAGGIAKPVMSPSSMNSMGQQSHFGARNVAQPKGAGLAAINMPARAPGAHLINSTVSGRTDRIPMRARTGSFVIPADVVSGLGEGNTMAGAKMWGNLLTHSVTGGATGGMRRGAAPALKGGIGRMGGVKGPGSRQLPAPKPIIAPPQKVPYQNLPTSVPKGYQDGGFMGHNGGPPIDDMDDDTTPIVTAGGEMIVDPEIVAAIGGGDSDAGSKILCKSVEAIRKQVQAFQKTLPGPSK